MSYPSDVTLVEVGPRDGLQSQPKVLSPEDIIEFVNRLSDAGLTNIEVGAFVNPKRVPQMAASEAVFHGIKRKKNVRYPVLVPNLKGLERALSVGVQEIALFTAASETFNQKNTNASIAESIARFKEVTTVAHQKKLWIRGYISTCFGCPFEGTVAPEKVLEVSNQLLDLGVDELSIGDTIGVATPKNIEDVFHLLLTTIPPSKLALHAHDTRGTALANCLRALELGIHTFDTSAGGVGGCPFAPGATGNLATEDLVYLLNGLEINHGVSLNALVHASSFLEAKLGTLPGRAYTALKKHEAHGEEQ